MPANLEPNQTLKPLAIQKGHVDIVRYLVSLGDEVNTRQLNAATKTGFTALAHVVTECREWGTKDEYDCSLNGCDYAVP